MAVRQRAFWAAVALLQLALAPAAAALPAKGVAAKSAQPQREKLAVMEIRAQRVDPLLASALDAVVLSELSADYDVIGKSDIVSMLGFEQQKQMLGCAEDASCLAEIGGALGVAHLVTGSLGQVGKIYLLTLNLHDPTRASVLKRVTEQVSGGEEELVSAVQRAVHKLLPGIPAAAAPVASVPAPAPAPAASGPGFGVARLAGLGAGAALVGVGAWFGVQALGTRDALSTLLGKPDPYGRELGTAATLREKYGRQAWLADGLVAGGVAVGVASWFLLAPKAAPGSGGDLTALPDPAHPGLLVTGRF